jgi:hypothetical protein
MDKQLNINNENILKYLFILILYKSIRMAELNSRPCYSGSPAYDF